MALLKHVESLASAATKHIIKEAEKNAAAVAGLFVKERQPYINCSEQKDVYLRHVKTGMFVHPLDCAAASGVPLAMYDPGPLPQRIYATNGTHLSNDMYA